MRTGHRGSDRLGGDEIAQRREKDGRRHVHGLRRGVPDVADAEADYELVKDLHTEAGLIDAYDAAVIERRADGKVKITKKHETPTRVGGVLGGGVGLATGLVVALFPFAAIGGGLLAATTAGGAVLGAVAGHAAAGMSRHDLKELGEQLDAGQAGLVVVGVSDMGAKIEQAISGPRSSKQGAQGGHRSDRGRRQGCRSGRVLSAYQLGSREVMRWPSPSLRSSWTRTDRPPLKRQVPVSGRGSWESMGSALDTA